MTLALDLDKPGKAPVTGFAGRFPCPQCHRPSSYLCGNALRLEPDCRYLVCWLCGLLLKMKRGEQWQRAKLPKRIPT